MFICYTFASVNLDFLKLDFLKKIIYIIMEQRFLDSVNTKIW